MINQGIQRTVGLFLRESIEGDDSITFTLNCEKTSPVSLWLSNDGLGDVTISFIVMDMLKTITIKTNEQMEIPFIVKDNNIQISIGATNNAYRCQIYTA